MKIEHVAIYAKNLEALRDFYVKYFQEISNEMYENPKKGFRSYFLSFSAGARLELMQKESIPESQNDPVAQATGLTHFAFSLGSRGGVDRLAERLRRDGFRIVDGPRQTGDGYYECAFSIRRETESRLPNDAMPQESAGNAASATGESLSF
jgi:lactoylglutathione lyase